MKNLHIKHPAHIGAPWLITIGPAPPSTVPATSMPAPFMLQPLQGTPQPYSLVLFARIPITHLCDTITWAAAGLHLPDFLAIWAAQYPQTTHHQQVAIYYWQKI